ncbi:MAG: NAD(+)/NADH kinase [Planctomycetes bacterium]|nr:NAD(+)/NADH kinase [Planctomycetota bacterium]
MSDKRVLVIGTQARPTVHEAIEQLRPVIERHAEAVVQDLECETPLPEGDIALAVVVGGDGSILKASRRLAPAGVPCLGVNVGRLGFLAGFSVEEVADALAAVLEDRARHVERMMLAVRIEKCDGHHLAETALNDVVFTQGASRRMIGVSVDINGEAVAAYHGDGVVLATPTGSTAYNLAAGGPIIEWSLEAMVITPICPHMLTHRSIAISSDSVVKMHLAEAERESTCIIDGQVQVPLVAGDVVRVTRAPHGLVMIENPQRSRFETLREKLHWSHPPRYARGMPGHPPPVKPKE